jgi:integrase
MEQDRPLPFDDENGKPIDGCLIHRHRVGTLRTKNIEVPDFGGGRRWWAIRFIDLKKQLDRGWCASCTDYAGKRRAAMNIEAQPATPAVVKAPRKPRGPVYDSLVKKRCSHPQSDWELCACAWHYHVTHQGKKFRNPIPDATTYDDAKKKYQTIAANIRNGRAPLHGFTAAGDGLTVAQLGEDWLDLPRGRKPTTIASYRLHLHAQINPVLGSMLLTAVTPDDCERWIKAIRSTRHEGKDVTTKTKKSMARTLHALFEFAIFRKKRTDNPATKLAKAIDDPNASPDNGVIDPNDHTKYFTQEEAQHLLAVCRDKFPEWYAFVLVGLQTGCRLGEIRGLCYEQINWRANYITIDQAYVKDAWTSPKNGKARTVTMSRDLRTVLYFRWRQQRQRALGRGPVFRGRTMQLVFPSPVGTPLQEKRINEWWEKLLEAAELGWRVRHAMRHTHTSLLLQNGASSAKVAEEAGRSEAETMATYAHFRRGGNGGEAEVLSSLLNPKTHVSGKRETTATKRQRGATILRVVSQN